MDFSQSGDRQMLADSLWRFLVDRYPFDVRQRIAASEEGYSRDIWKALAELGMVGALFDAKDGGFGGSGFDIATVFEALGRALVVEPFLNVLLAGSVIVRAEAGNGVLDGLIDGTIVAAFAHQEPEGRYALEMVATRAKPCGDGWILSGAKAVVPQLEGADFLVISARTEGESDDEEGISLFLVPRDATGISIQGYPLIDGGRGGELLLDKVTIGGHALLGRRGQGLDLLEAAVAAGLVALCAEAVGVMDVIKDMTVEYLQIRSQFGVPIGKFQALQHRMATMLIEIEQARSAMINAASSLGGDRYVRERAVSAAKFTIGRVGTLVAEEAIQMHGGIGMTWELPLSHYAKRLTMIGHQLGDEDHHLERYVGLTSQHPMTPERQDPFHDLGD